MAEEAGYDLGMLVARLQESQERRGDRVATRPPRNPEKQSFLGVRLNFWDLASDEIEAAKGYLIQELGAQVQT